MARGTFQLFTAKTEIAPSAAQQTKLFLEYSIHWSFVFPFIQHAWHALFSNPLPFPFWLCCNSFTIRSVDPIGSRFSEVPHTVTITDKLVSFPWIVTDARLCFAYLLHWTIPSPCCTLIILAYLCCV